MKNKAQPTIQTGISRIPSNKLSAASAVTTTAKLALTEPAATSGAVAHNIQTYEDMKGHLTDYYSEFVKNPESFGANAELIAKIKNMNSLQAKGLWVLFKQQFKIELGKMQNNDLAQLLFQDLAEDGVSVASKEVLKMIFKAPEKYPLEPDMIAAIKRMSSAEKDQLMEATSSLYDIELNNSVGHKILAFVQDLWEDLAPTFENIFKSLVTYGVRELSSVMDQKLPKDVSNILKEELDNVGASAVKITSTTITGLIDDGLQGKSALATVKKSAIELSTTIVEQTAEAGQKIVMTKSEQVTKLVELQLGLGNSLAGAHVDETAVLLGDAEHHV